MFYDILYSQTLDDMIEQVEQRMEDGWKPAGGIATNTVIDDGEPTEVFYQAIIKE